MRPKSECFSSTATSRPMRAFGFWSSVSVTARSSRLLPGFSRMWLVEHEFGLDRELVSWIRSGSADEIDVHA